MMVIRGISSDTTKERKQKMLKSESNSSCSCTKRDQKTAHKEKIPKKPPDNEPTDPKAQGRVLSSAANASKVEQSHDAED